MTREEFKKELDNEGYSYNQEGDKIIVNHNGLVYLDSLKTLPDEVVFSNRGEVYLPSLETLPKGIIFSNDGHVNLDFLKSISNRVVFSNLGYVYMEELIGGWFYSWGGNIERISPKRLLNKMIKDGLFDKK